MVKKIWKPENTRQRYERILWVFFDLQYIRGVKNIYMFIHLFITHLFLILIQFFIFRLSNKFATKGPRHTSHRTSNTLRNLCVPIYHFFRWRLSLYSDLAHSNSYPITEHILCDSTAIVCHVRDLLRVLYLAARQCATVSLLKLEIPTCINRWVIHSHLNLIN